MDYYSSQISKLIEELSRLQESSSAMAKLTGGLGGGMPGMPF